MTPQVEMLLDCVKIMEEGGKYPSVEAFERLLEWIAVQIKLPSGIEECGITTSAIKVETAEQLDRTLDIALLRLEIGDHLRQAAQELGILEAPAISMMTPTTAETTHPAVLDAEAGSGTYLVDLFKQHGRSYLYYGASTNLLEYRMALVTMHLYGVPSMILKAAAESHVLDIDSPNWESANMWYYSHEKNLERKPEPLFLENL